MKAHIGVDAPSGLVHSVAGTAANVADIAQTHRLLHGEEKKGYVDAGYLGVEKRPQMAARAANVSWFIAAKRGQVRALEEGWVKDLTQAFEKLKTSARAGWTSFHIVKNLFKLAKRAIADWPRIPLNFTPFSR